MSIQWVPALRCKDDLETVAAVGDPPDNIGIQQGRDYVQLTEAEARKLLDWLRSALPQQAPQQCPYAEDGSYCGYSGTGPCPCRKAEEK